LEIKAVFESPGHRDARVDFEGMIEDGKLDNGLSGANAENY
jgi:hypothetical protein